MWLLEMEDIDVETGKSVNEIVQNKPMYIRSFRV